MIIRREQHIKHTVVVTQRRCPLALAIYGAAFQTIIRRVIECIEHITDHLPVDEVARAHHRTSRHKMHGCGHHIKVLTHSYNIGVGHIGPQHGIDHTAVIKILSSYHCRTHSHYHHHDTYQKSSHYIIVFIAKNIIVLSLFHGPLRINRAEALLPHCYASLPSVL